MSDFRQRGDIQHFEAGISDGLGEDQTGLRPDRLAETLDVARMDLGGLDAEARQGMAEKIVAAAIERAGGNDVRASPHKRHDGEMQGRVTAGGCHSTDAAFKRRHALFQHRDGRIRNPRIDVPGPLQVEQRGRMFGVPEHIGCGLVDRHRAGACIAVRLLAGMQRERVETEKISV